MGVYQDLENDFDYEIIEEFFGHFSFMLDSIENLIVNLNDQVFYKRNINELFRIFHTIKSASAYLKITPILKLVTLAEEVLEECRNLDGEASDTLISWLLIVADRLSSYKDDLEYNRETFSKLDRRIIKVPTIYLKKA